MTAEFLFKKFGLDFNRILVKVLIIKEKRRASKMKKVLFVLFGMIIVLMSLMNIGCREKKTTPTFMLVPKSVGHPYWVEVERGMNAMARELGVKAIFNGPPTASSALQISIIEGAISSKVSGIGISPNEPEAVEAIIKSATEKGIPVITFDSDSPKSLRSYYVGTDNYQAGKILGEQFIKIAGTKGKIALLTGGLGAMNLNERIRGFKDAIAAYPELKIVTLQANNDDESLTFSQAEAILQSHPDLLAFAGFNAPAAPGAARAVKALNKKGKIKIVGFDTVPITLDFIRQGYIQGTVGQRPYMMGYVGLKVLYDIHMGKELELPEGLKAADGIIDTGIIFVTAENINEHFPVE
jgi:ribose transport system substrate-binding protein